MSFKSTLMVKPVMLALLLLVFNSIFAQKTITGKVLNKTGSAPISGASIRVIGTNVGTQTNDDGTFSLNVPKDNSVLQISVVGFDNIDVPVNGRASIGTLSLNPTASTLNEVVVTGYTAQKRKEITGAVSVVSVKDLKSIPTGTAEQMLQGQAAGLNIIGSGSPGEGSNVFIRGITSFGNVSPLVIVDGVQSAPGDLTTLHDLSANDIESVQVLKDAQAAIYGVRGSAGVIIVTTKRGRGKSTITYDGYYGTQRVLQGNPWNTLDTKGMAELYFLAAKNSLNVDSAGNVNSSQYGTGTSPVIPDFIKAGNASGVSASNPSTNPALYNNNYAKGDIFLIVPANKIGTDWFHAVFKPAPIQSHTVTASGGSEKSAYLFSFNYFNQQGTLLNTYLKRYATRINTVFNVKNNIRVGENVYMYYKDNPRIGNNQESNAVSLSAQLQPIIPKYDIGGGFGGTSGTELGNASNPFANQTRSRDNRNNDWQIQGDVFAEVDFLHHFTAKTLFGGNLGTNYGFYHNYRTYENKENGANNGYGEYANYTSNWNFTNTLTYNNIFALNHSVKALVGYEAISYKGRGLGGNRIGYFSDDPNFLSLNTGSNSGQSNNSYSYLRTGTAVLAKLDYAFRDKYLLGLNGRRDGNSVFGPNSRYGNFYSVSAGWVVSEESFIKSIAFINSLKLRGSYGVLGSVSNVPAGNAFTTYGGSGNNAYYDINGTSNSTERGFYASSYGNLNTSFEQDKILDFGIDATVLKNRLDISVDWYKKQIEGLLFQDQAAATAGVGADLPQVNIGDMQNTGVDLSATYHSKINKDVNFSLGANFGTYKSVIVNIPGAAGYFETAGTHNTGNQVRNQTGHPVGSFYGYKIIGIYQDAADVAKSPTEKEAAPGRFKYEDVNGDNKIDDADRTFYGNPNPDFTLGVNLSISYKHFDFSTVFYGSFGNDLLNYNRYFNDFYPQFQNAKNIKLLTNSWIPADRSKPRDQWTAINPNADYPIVENGSYFSTNGVLNDFYNENGSYFRCKQMMIGYTIAPGTLKRAGIEKARVYLQAANLFTITKYTGLDPEVSGSAASFGVDYGNYPPSKTFNVGVSLTF
jgi:TonB-linked SusC/RagA family outer membrane protein